MPEGGGTRWDPPPEELEWRAQGIRSQASFNTCPPPPSPRSAADHFCARRVQGLGDQGSQLAGGRDESPSEMRNLGPTCNPMDSFLA